MVGVRRRRTIDILISATMNNYFKRNLSKLILSDKCNPDVKHIISAVLFKLNAPRGEALTKFTKKEAQLIRKLLDTSIGILSTRTIPEYEKRGNEVYKEKAERRLTYMTNLLNKLDNKLRVI